MEQHNSVSAGADAFLHQRLSWIEGELQRLMSLQNNQSPQEPQPAPDKFPPQRLFNPEVLARPPAQSFAAGRAKMVRKLIHKRRRRERHFDAEIFADPAWDMLLDLYAAHYERQRVSVSSLCIAAAVPATTALRWIKTMCDTGKFLRECDPYDGRRIFISLSEETRLKMDAYFEDCAED